MSKSESLRSTLARNTIVSWFSYAVAALTALFLTPLIVKGVGAPGYGVWILLTQLTGYAGVLDLGIQPAVSKYVAQKHANADRVGLRTVLTTALVIHLSIAVLVVVLLACLSFFLPRWFDVSGVPHSESRAALVLIAVGTAIGFPASVFSAALKGYLRFDIVSSLLIAAQLVRAVVILAVLLTGGGLIGLAWASVLSSTVGLLGGAFFFFKESDSVQLKLSRFSSSVGKQLFAFGFFCSFGSLGWYLGYGSGAVLIGATLTASDVAHYGLALSPLAVLSGMVVAFSQSFMPLASGYEAAGKSEALQRAYLAGTRYCLLITLPMAMAFVLLATTLMSLWLGAELGLASGPLLRILTLGSLISIANGPGLQMALGIGLQRRVALISICEGIVSLALSYLLIGKIGVMGVAYGMLAASLIFQGVVWPASLRSALDISLGRYWAEALRPALLPALAALIVFASLFYGTGARIPVLLLGYGGVMATVYWVVAYFAFFSSDERAAWLGRATLFLTSMRGARLAKVTPEQN